MCIEQGMNADLSANKLDPSVFETTAHNVLLWTALDQPPSHMPEESFQNT